MTQYRREEHWKFEYEVCIKDEWVRKACYPTSKEGVERCKADCERKGFRFLKATKLYPFNMMKHNHNFFLIYNITANRMHDMEAGEIEWNEKEFDRLEKLHERASYFMGQMHEIEWLPYEEWAEANNLAQMAIDHRAEACIRNGRADLVGRAGYEEYC